MGAAGSTGRGEANLYNLSSFLIVEDMRRGHAPQGRGHGGAEAHPRQHGREAAAQRAAATPDFYVKFYVVNRKGEFAGVAMYARGDGKQQTYAVCTENGPQTLPLEALLEDAEGRTEPRWSADAHPRRHPRHARARWATSWSRRPCARWQDDAARARRSARTRRSS